MLSLGEETVAEFEPDSRWQCDAGTTTAEPNSTGPDGATRAGSEPQVEPKRVLATARFAATGVEPVQRDWGQPIRQESVEAVGPTRTETMREHFELVDHLRLRRLTEVHQMGERESESPSESGFVAAAERPRREREALAVE